MRRKEPVATTVNYFDKAYLHGTQQQKSRAALLAAMRLIEDNNIVESRNWLNRANAPEAQFDKHILEARIAEAEKNWPAAEDALLRAEFIVSAGRSNAIFNADDLLVAHLRIAREQPPAEALNSIRSLYRRYSAAKIGRASCRERV